MQGGPAHKGVSRLRYAISGAAGFIGSHLCEHLLNDGHQVVGLDNFITGAPANLEGFQSNPSFEFLQADVTASVRVDGPIDCALHLASLASPRDYLAHPIETLDAGSAGTRNMLELARQHNASFLLASTSECYGDPLEHPQSETYWGNVNPVGPRSCYDESKRYAEALTMAYHREYGLATHIARIFNTYGPRMQLHDGRVVPEFIAQALDGQPLTVYGSGSQTRSFCYITDLVRGLILLSRSAEPYPVNLGNPDEMTILEFAERIRAATGVDSGIEFKPCPEDDPKRRRPDIAKARQLLRWQPEIPLEQGLRETIAYFKNRK
jgi:dTDP-glucose 4,6-dehydratase